MSKPSVEVIHAGDWLVSETPHRRIRWTPESDDLHVNLVDLQPGADIGEHVNASLDVLLTCLDGTGTLHVDGKRYEMETGSIALIRRGARRAVAAGPEGLRYTTCHRRRGGLMPTVQERT